MAKFADGMDSLSLINKAIEMPDRLMSEDGRIFTLVEWKPAVKSDAYISIEMTVHVQMETEE